MLTLDDFGRYHGTDLALLAAAYPVPPAGMTSKRFAAALEELLTADVFRRYESGGRVYIYSPTWTKYQRLRAMESKFPQPLCNEGGGHQAVISPPSAAGVGVGVGVGNGEQTRPSAPRGASVRDEFVQFWSAYPRKVGKRKAEEAYRRAKHRDGQPGFLQRTLDAIARQKQSRQWLTEGGRYIPHPTTWLNGDRLEDQVETDSRVADELPPLRLEG